MDEELTFESMQDASAFATNPNTSIIKVIGVGGGGSNAVDYMYSQHIPNVEFVVSNTDSKHLRLCKVPQKLLLGHTGLGAGNNPEVGRKCAEESVEQIQELFNDNTEMVFISAGMGGGTGTGAAPVIARIAKEANMLTIGIVTVPFMFEGESKILKALDGADELKKHVDALLVINNENLVELYPELDIFNAFEKVDETLSNAARSISEIITEPCYISVDFNDVKTVLRNAGTAIISTAYAEGENRITEAINQALHSPLLKRHDIRTARRLLLKLGVNRKSSHKMLANEINEIRAFTNQLPPTIDVKWGIGDYEELGDKVKVTVLAAGFDVTLRGESAGDGNGNGAAAEPTIIFGGDPEKPAVKKPNEVNAARLEEMYGTETVRRSQWDMLKQSYAILQPTQFDDDDFIAMIDRQPARHRDSKVLSRIYEKTPAQKPEEQRPAQGRDNNSNEDLITFG